MERGGSPGCGGLGAPGERAADCGLFGAPGGRKMERGGSATGSGLGAADGSAADCGLLGAPGGRKMERGGSATGTGLGAAGGIDACGAFGRPGGRKMERGGSAMGTCMEAATAAWISLLATTGLGPAGCLGNIVGGGRGRPPAWAAPFGERVSEEKEGAKGGGAGSEDLARAEDGLGSTIGGALPASSRSSSRSSSSSTKSAGFLRRAIKIVRPSSATKAPAPP